MMDKVVLITGASGGLGKHTADAFAKQGFTVYGTSRKVQLDRKSHNGSKPQSGLQSEADYKQQPGSDEIRMLQLDVCSEQSCTAAVKQIISDCERIDILINNAGFGIAGPLELTSDEEAHRQMETNFFGPIRMIRAVLPHMRKQGSGRIINIGSAAAPVPIPYQSMYSASKSSLEVLSQAVGMEVAPFGIKMSCIEFGDMKTGFTSHREKVKTDVHAAHAYQKRYQKSISRMEHDEQHGPPPTKAAKLVVRTALKKNPKAVKVCGVDYKLLVLLRRCLPIRFSNFIIAKLYG